MMRRRARLGIQYTLFVARAWAFKRSALRSLSAIPLHSTSYERDSTSTVDTYIKGMGTRFKAALDNSWRRSVNMLYRPATAQQPLSPRDGPLDGAPLDQEVNAYLQWWRRIWKSVFPLRHSHLLRQGFADYVCSFQAPDLMSPGNLSETVRGVRPCSLLQGKRVYTRILFTWLKKKSMLCIEG